MTFTPFQAIKDHDLPPQYQKLFSPEENLPKDVIFLANSGHFLLPIIFWALLSVIFIPSTVFLIASGFHFFPNADLFTKISYIFVSFLLIFLTLWSFSRFRAHWQFQKQAKTATYRLGFYFTKEYFIDRAENWAAFYPKESLEKIEYIPNLTNPASRAKPVRVIYFDQEGITNAHRLSSFFPSEGFLIFQNWKKN